MALALAEPATASAQLFLPFETAETRSEHSYEPASSDNYGVQVAEPEAPRRVLGISHQSRIERPTRIGSVMLQLLRSYGITEDEIAEGLAAYATKQAAQQAS